MSNEHWKDELQLKGWRRGKTVLVGLDLDGDLGLLDEKGYSIIILRSEMPKLLDWLQGRIAESEPCEIPPFDPVTGEPL